MKNLKMMLKFWLKLESARKNVEVSRSHIYPTQAQSQGQKCKPAVNRQPGYRREDSLSSSDCTNMN